MEEETSEGKQRSGMSIRNSLIWRVGKKIAVTAIVITCAPFVLPPLIVGSSIGFALSLPFGMLFVGYACTQKVMSMLLSGLQVQRTREREREVEEEEEEEEEEEFEEDVKRRLEMRIALVEDDDTGSGSVEEEETGYERIGVEEAVSGVHDEEEVESLHGHGDVKGFVEDEKMDEGIVVEEPARGVDEQETRNQQGSDMTRVSEERMEDKDENAEDKGDDIGIVAEEQVSGVHDEDEVESLHGHGDVKGSVEDEKMDEGIVVEEPSRGVDEQVTRNQQGSDMTRVSEEYMEDKDENAERRGYEEDYNVKEDDNVEDDEGIVAEEPVSENKDEQDTEQLGVGVAEEEQKSHKDDVKEDDKLVGTKGVVDDELVEKDEITDKSGLNKDYNDKDYDRLPNAKENTKLGIVVGGALGGGGDNKQNVENPLVTRDSEQGKESDDQVIDAEKFVDAKKRKKYQKKKDRKKKRTAVEEPVEDSLGREEETELDLSLAEPKGKEEAPTEERDVFVEGSANEAEDRITGQGNENGVDDEKPAHTQMEGVIEENHQVTKEIPIMEVSEATVVTNPSEVDLLDEETPTSEQYKSETDETSEDKAPQACVSRPVDIIDDESQHESTAVSSITEEHGSDAGEESVDSAAGVASKEVVHREEKIWGQIDSMRKILGCKGEKQATFYEEIRALYVFTGVEPPAAFEDPVDLVEVDDKLRLLMAIVGVK